MIINIDFNSGEAIYVQLCNQIILGIASSHYNRGDMLPSVRQLAGELGVNMHTVNKAYAILRNEGYITLTNRKGAIISVDYDKIRLKNELKNQMSIIIAKGICHNIDIEEMHDILDEVFSDIKNDCSLEEE